MKVSYNGIQIKESRAEELFYGEVFHFESWYYMKFKLGCKGVDGLSSSSRMVCAMNLHSGTMRLIPGKSVIIPLQAKAVLRDKVMHRTQEGEEIET